MIFDLFWRFVLISLLAFGGGAAALPLVERLAVSEAGWMSPQDFAVAVACGYVTPGPVLITATFVGYRAAGLSGAVAATFGVFLMPWLLAARPPNGSSASCSTRGWRALVGGPPRRSSGSSASQP